MRVTKDFHIHERHSGDARGANVVDYCRVAEERGFDEICFTTHLIITGPDTDHSVPPDKIQEYVEEIESVGESTSVKLRTGLEVDYFPEEERRLGRILDEHALDFVLGSMHYIRGFDIGARPGSMAFFGGRRIEESLDIYYEGWTEAIESGLFDVMAHPDYWRKYLHLTHHEQPSFKDYGQTVLKAIDSLKSCGVGVEVNPSGHRHGIGDCYPKLEFLLAIREAGIETVTIGSDCHSIDRLGENLEEAVMRLREAGYSEVSVFRERRNSRIRLSEIIK